MSLLYFGILNVNFHFNSLGSLDRTIFVKILVHTFIRSHCFASDSTLIGLTFWAQIRPIDPAKPILVTLLLSLPKCQPFIEMLDLLWTMHRCCFSKAGKLVQVSSWCSEATVLLPGRLLSNMQAIYFILLQPQQLLIVFVGSVCYFRIGDVVLYGHIIGIKFHFQKDRGQWRPIRSHASFRGLMASRRLLGLFSRRHTAPEQRLARAQWKMLIR